MKRARVPRATTTFPQKMLSSALNGEANSFLLHKGWISVKKGLMYTKKYAALCAPTTISDIQALYEFLFIAESNTPIPLDEKAIPWLGSIAFSAVRGLNINRHAIYRINAIRIKN